jgi:putative aminopeptidase FrvX
VPRATAQAAAGAAPVGFAPARMAAPEFLIKLLSAAGPSGNERDAARVWREGCEPWATEVASDNVGSSMARVAGTAGGPTLIIVGHIDEIGLIVTHIEDSGHLRVSNVGGWDNAVLLGQRFRVLTRNGTIPGVVSRPPIHLLKDDDRKKIPELRTLHLDVGAADGDEARTLVRVGDVAVIDADPVEFRNDRLVARAIDNRVGCYIAAEAARLVAQAGGAPGDVVALAVTQEETTFAGARTSAFALEPDAAIVVDGTFATDQPGVDESEHGKHPLGSGPSINRGTTLHPAVFDRLCDVADQEGIANTLEASGRATGTDADAIHVSRSGVPTGVVSVPVRYMHSPVEMVSLADIADAAKLIAAFASGLEPGMSFAR